MSRVIKTFLSPLPSTSQLCESAQAWANHLAASNEFYYRSNKTIGQNLFCCPVSALVTDLTGKRIGKDISIEYKYF